MLKNDCLINYLCFLEIKQINGIISLFWTCLNLETQKPKSVPISSKIRKDPLIIHTSSQEYLILAGVLFTKEACQRNDPWIPVMETDKHLLKTFLPKTGTRWIERTKNSYKQLFQVKWHWVCLQFKGNQKIWADIYMSMLT